MDDDIIPNVSDDSLLRDDSSSMDPDPDSLVAVSSDDPSIEPLADEVEIQALDSGYYNYYKFPDTLQELVDSGIGATCSTSGIRPNCSYFLYSYSLSSFIDDSTMRITLLYKSVNSSYFVAVNVNVDTNSHRIVNYVSQNGFSGTHSVVYSNSRPLYYGVTKFKEVTSADVLMIPATILAVAFFAFVYKIIKRVLF